MAGVWGTGFICERRSHGHGFSSPWAFVMPDTPAATDRTIAKGTKSRGPAKPVRATLAFRQRHFVASSLSDSS